VGAGGKIQKPLVQNTLPPAKQRIWNLIKLKVAKHMLLSCFVRQLT